MSYDHRRAIAAAEDHVLKLGRLLEKGGLSGVIHPAHAEPADRWRDAGFAILRNESEETEADQELRKVFTPHAHELSGFMHRITDGAMTVVLKNTDHATFFEPVYRIFAGQMVKPTRKGPKSASGPAWEVLAMRAIVSHALSWLKTVKPEAPKPTKPEGLLEDRPESFEEYLRQKGLSGEHEIEKAAEELSKSLDGLAAEVKGISGPPAYELLYIAGIPGHRTPRAWFPQLSPFVRLDQAQLERVHRKLVRLKLDPAPAMSQLYAHFLVQCGHLGVDSKPTPPKVNPPQD